MFGVASKLFLIVMAAFLARAVLLRSRAQASRSAARRWFLLIRGGVAVALGLGLVFALAPRAIGSPESPAGLATMLLLWLVGGGLGFLGAASMVGAAIARPRPAKDGDSGA
jgi:glucose dehydrogenase